jgi:hypothetical protein
MLHEGSLPPSKQMLEVNMCHSKHVWKQSSTTPATKAAVYITVEKSRDLGERTKLSCKIRLSHDDRESGNLAPSE